MYLLLIFLLTTSTGEIPPGTVRVGDLFVDKTEISNIHWIEFLTSLCEKADSATVSKFFPDSSNTWYKDAERRYEPIVMITYEQAVAYCQRRSFVVSKGQNRRITYRLPTPEEWNKIANHVLSEDPKHIKKERTAAEKANKRATHKNRYVVFVSDEFDDRVYHLFDNVSEMTSVRNVAMGSNNLDIFEIEQNLTKTIRYESPNIYLGFRCVAEVE